ncbi:hypothetical protein [Flavobacterium hydrophilum]|uniref:Uncharacterized protein n=1 Tax=Flavobacterium hydrophilum TaxID=2211445 RepID=A0A2V4BWU6_9FLAO|nr:hypothetical protein [Flavobacterium hydrophilum]PXY43147.1 hypothetical protein DMB68_22380 [Flavobacterium hydrophilum]
MEEIKWVKKLLLKKGLVNNQELNTIEIELNTNKLAINDVINTYKIRYKRTLELKDTNLSNLFYEFLIKLERDLNEVHYLRIVKIKRNSNMKIFFVDSNFERIYEIW